MQYLVFLCIISYIVTQKTLSIITYNREELLDIRETSTTRNTTFQKADPLSAPPRVFELVPEADPKRRRQRRGCQSGLLVRLRMGAHHPPLQSILLANVQSLVDKIRARVAFQRDIWDCNVLCFTETWLAGDMLSESIQPTRFSASRRQELTSLR